MRCFVMMGVAGCGKSTVGQALAAQTGMTYIEGDALHSEDNIRKMTNGVPLGDEDRLPWLGEVGRALATTPGPVGVGCSALKRKYRDLIRTKAGEPVAFLHLHAPQDAIAARMAEREGHFMPESLLASQFKDLEMLEPDELGHLIDIEQPLEAVLVAAEHQIVEMMK